VGVPHDLLAIDQDRQPGLTRQLLDFAALRAPLRDTDLLVVVSLPA